MDKEKQTMVLHLVQREIRDLHKMNIDKSYYLTVLKKIEHELSSTTQKREKE